MPGTVERTDYGELISEVSGWPYIYHYKTIETENNPI
jgi:hypothetical protein